MVAFGSNIICLCLILRENFKVGFNDNFFINTEIKRILFGMLSWISSFVLLCIVFVILYYADNINPRGKQFDNFRFHFVFVLTLCTQILFYFIAHCTTQWVINRFKKYFQGRETDILFPAKQNNNNKNNTKKSPQNYTQKLKQAAKTKIRIASLISSSSGSSSSGSNNSAVTSTSKETHNGGIPNTRRTMSSSQSHLHIQQLSSPAGHNHNHSRDMSVSHNRGIEVSKSFLRNYAFYANRSSNVHVGSNCSLQMANNTSNVITRAASGSIPSMFGYGSDSNNGNANINMNENANNTNTNTNTGTTTSPRLRQGSMLSLRDIHSNSNLQHTCTRELSSYEVSDTEYMSDTSTNTNTTRSSRKSIKKDKQYKLHHCLRNEVTFELFISHLSKEYSLELLLAFLEMTQWKLLIYRLFKTSLKLKIKGIKKEVLTCEALLPDGVPKSEIVFQPIQFKINRNSDSESNSNHSNNSNSASSPHSNSKSNSGNNSSQSNPSTVNNNSNSNGDGCETVVYRLIDKEIRINHCKHVAFELYSKYITIGCEYEINISSSMRESLIGMLGNEHFWMNKVNINEIDLFNLFDDARNEVYRLLQFSFVRIKSAKLSKIQAILRNDKTKNTNINNSHQTNNTAANNNNLHAVTTSLSGNIAVRTRPRAKSNTITNTNTNTNTNTLSQSREPSNDPNNTNDGETSIEIE